MSMLSNLDLIRRVSLFTMLTPPQAEALAATVSKKRFKRGEVIVALRISFAVLTVIKRRTITVRSRVSPDRSTSDLSLTCQTPTYFLVLSEKQRKT